MANDQKHIFRIYFHNQGQIYEVYARSIYQSDLYGFVEIEETRRAGGVAVGIASREDGGTGCDPWKARRLQDVGAHLLVSDWLQSDLLLRTLGITV